MPRAATWLLALVAVGAAAIAVVYAAGRHSLGGPADPRITRTMRADPIAHFTPLQAVGQPRTLVTGPGGKGTWQSVARYHRTFLVPAATSRLAFRDTVRAARDAGWHVPDSRPAERALDPGELDVRTAGKTTIPGKAFTLTLSLRQHAPTSDGSTPATERELAIDLDAS